MNNSLLRPFLTKVGRLAVGFIVGLAWVAPAHATEYAIGADLSFLQQAETGGTVFKEEGKPRAALQIFKDHGYNWIRLRLWHTPTGTTSSLNYTLKQAQAAKKLGFKFLLDFHYSDTWADPEKQFVPKAWEGKSVPELEQAVFDYSRDTIAAFRATDAMPDMVQIGNEITPGMLWPTGKLPENWDNFAKYLESGIRGVEAGSGEAPRPKIMIHIDRGGNKAISQAFFSKLNSYNVNYDVIGLSYYPWWHGSLLNLRDNVNFLATTFNKDIILAEVAYCWRPTEYKTKPAPFPETPEGQRQFLEEVNQIVLNAPNNRGKGLFWWEPAVAGGFLGSRAMFDDQGNALPVINVFDHLTR